MSKRSNFDPPGDDDPALFALMALSYRKPQLAQAAWSKLFTRYQSWLVEHIERRYGRLVGGESGAQDLAHEVWVRAYARAGSYVAQPNLQPAETEMWTKGWLRSLARNVFRDQLLKEGRCYAPERGTGAPLQPKISKRRGLSDDLSEDAEGRERLELILCVIGGLSEREQDVFHVSFQWYGLEDKQCRIPQEELSFLCRRWGIDEAYIRQIRRRVLKMVESALERRSLGLEMARTG